MTITLQKVSCGHRTIGRDGPAITIAFVSPDGKRRAAGHVCSSCATTWGPRGFIQFATMHIIAAISWQPRLGPVQIAFDGIEQIYSAPQRAEILAGCTRSLRLCAEQDERLNLRELGHALPSAEIEQRITFSL